MFFEFAEVWWEEILAAWKLGFGGVNNMQLEMCMFRVELSFFMFTANLYGWLCVILCLVALAIV